MKRIVSTSSPRGRKLLLRREAIAMLTPAQLQQAAGGFEGSGIGCITTSKEPGCPPE
jgi:hypothetical protein